ncbi:MAG: AraC family transcriptional regulator [Lachnospiraceae bacterium]|nr:AraC family transcriptional regulator [Lachnospiraceae bacterium]MDE7333210.1 AraC family transcriptional regulator [Lachnospiraceae bacterium]
MPKTSSARILSTPSAYAKSHYFYVQEVGTLQSLEPHISKRQNLNSFLFLTVLDGEGALSYCGEQRRLSAGDCVFINCAQPYSHESSASHPWSLKWVHFNGPDARSYYDYYISRENPYLFHPRSILPFTDALDQLYLCHQTKSPLMELTSNKYITDIITLCFTENESLKMGEYTISAKIRQVHEYISENYHQKISLEDLSSRFFISKYHLSREYKKFYGVTLGNALASQRISHAKSMLRFSDDSIDTIALNCGFQDSGYFIKVFKRTENMTPLQYRKKW